MTLISPELIERSVAILGRSGVTQTDIEAEVLSLCEDEVVARRLIDFTTEAFGMTLVAHVSTKIVLPTSFSAKSLKGNWLWFPFSVEPIFQVALKIAQRIYHEGPRELFRNIAVRASTTDTINNALNSGVNLDGAVLSGPVMLGIPAEIYPEPRKTLVQKFFQWRLDRLKSKRNQK